MPAFQDLFMLLYVSHVGLQSCHGSWKTYGKNKLFVSLNLFIIVNGGCGPHSWMPLHCPLIRIFLIHIWYFDAETAHDLYRRCLLERVLWGFCIPSCPSHFFSFRVWVRLGMYFTFLYLSVIVSQIISPFRIPRRSDPFVIHDGKFVDIVGLNHLKYE